MRSRLVSIYPSVLHRTIVTKSRNVVNNENSQSSQQDNVGEEHFISTVSHQPPRRPVAQQFTHQVTNQVPPLECIDLYESDLALREFVTDDKCGQIKEMGAELGTYHWFEQGHRANRQVPTLHQFDRYGQRIDEIHFHPAYHELMRIGMKYGVCYFSSMRIYLTLYRFRFILLLGSHYLQATIKKLTLMGIYNMQ